MKKRYIIPAIILVLLISGFVFFGVRSKEKGTDIIVDVENGEFIVDITTTGELEAKNSVPIIGPRGVRSFRIWNMTIQRIVEEGTEVKKGDWVAELDKSEIQGQIQEELLEVEQSESQFIQTQLDTALVMRQARDELINLAYTVEEKEIQLAQSQYEPPAVIKQAEIDLDKARRALDQAEGNYQIKLKQNIAKMREASAVLNESRMNYDQREEILRQFTIKAPDDGMVMYVKGYDGKPIKAGSQINAWDPVVASLPDLSTMLSVTFVNEVDIRKIKPGQKVEIGLDAFPDKKLTGKVISVANAGEQRPNTDSKVFQTVIEISGTDPALRPAMTTMNKIIIEQKDEVNYIPLECLHSKNDSITYVYKKAGLGIQKQEVKTGIRNNNAVVIELGLDKGDRVYLSVPEGKEKEAIKLLAELDGKRNEKAKGSQVVEQDATARRQQRNGEGEQRRQGQSNN